MAANGSRSTQHTQTHTQAGTIHTQTAQRAIVARSFCQERAHTHGEYATLSRCERDEPTRANESREAQQNAQKYSAQRRSRSRTTNADADCDSGGQRRPN